MIKRLSLVCWTVGSRLRRPLAAQAYGGSNVSVTVSTPEFGFRIGAPSLPALLPRHYPVYVPAPIIRRSFMHRPR